MTRLTLLRHAKSSWDHSNLHDIERPLNARGRRDATLMGLVCGERLPPPDLVLVSPALRTRETVELFFGAWITAKPEFNLEEGLYLAGRRDWMHVLSEAASDADHILACSHQPGVGEFAGWLCRDFDGEVPTATVISIVLDSGRLKRHSGVPDFIGRPKDFRV